MKKYYLAIDIGATSGRHILAHYDENNELVYEEVYRFLNKTITKDGHLFWDVNLLFKNIIDGLKECKKINKIPTFIGIDTFGVDYCLLDENDKLVRDLDSVMHKLNIKEKQVSVAATQTHVINVNGSKGV